MGQGGRESRGGSGGKDTQVFGLSKLRTKEEGFPENSPTESWVDEVWVAGTAWAEVMLWLLGESQLVPLVNPKHCSTHNGDVAVTAAELSFLFLKKVKKDKKKVVWQLKKT